MSNNWEVYEVVDGNDVLVKSGLTKEEASELANSYGNFENGDPCAWYKQAAG